jgi:hypothetical protein
VVIELLSRLSSASQFHTERLCKESAEPSETIDFKSVVLCCVPQNTGSVAYYQTVGTCEFHVFQID